MGQLGQIAQGLICLLLVLQAQADISEYKHVEYKADAIYTRPGVFMFSPADAPDDSSPGAGKSYFQLLDLTVTREDASRPANIQFTIVHEGFEDKIGFVDPDDGNVRKYCCTPELIGRKICSTPERLIIQDRRAVFQQLVRLPVGQKYMTVPERKFEVEATGMYIQYISNCMTNQASVYVDGKIVFMNPYGYLRGQDYPFLAFYGVSAILYGFFAVIWFVLCARHWRELTQVQFMITAILGLSLIEAAAHYSYYSHWNETGTVAHSYWFASTVHLINGTLARVLILVVSMGYSVNRPTLGSSGYKVALLGVLFFIFASISKLVDDMTYVKQVTEIVQAVANLPQALIDSIFYWWIFFSLSRNFTILEQKKQDVKLMLFKRLIRILTSALIITIFWILYFWMVGRDSLRGEQQWVDRGFWAILFMFIMVSIMILWSPSENSRRYAYSQVEDDEPVGHALSSVSTVSREKDAFRIEDDDEDDVKMV